MKKILINRFIIAAAFSTVFSFTACKKNDNTPAVAKGVLVFHLHTDIDTNEVDAGTIAMDATGRRFELDLAQFYISGIVLHKADGSTYSLSSSDYVLKNIAQEEYVIDSVPAGNYTSVSFNVGIDAAANATAPSSYPATSVLSAQSPSMWFGSTAQGYIFMNIQGKADTTAAQTGLANMPFSYQIGTNSLLKNVSLPNKAFSVVANQQTFVHMIADYGKALTGVNFKTQPTANPTTNISVATQIANNIPGMFSYEE